MTVLICDTVTRDVVRFSNRNMVSPGNGTSAVVSGSGRLLNRSALAFSAPGL